MAEESADSNRRILITGCCGAGKSTLAQKLAMKLDIPLIHLDKHYWLPQWQETERERWREKVSQLVAGDEWIMDGNFSGTFDLRFPRATTLVYLDFPRTLCLYRCIKRSFQSWRQVRPDMGDDCPERFDLSFYKYVWNYHKNQGKRFSEHVENFFTGKLITLKTQAMVDLYLANTN